MGNTIDCCSLENLPTYNCIHTNNKDSLSNNELSIKYNKNSKKKVRINQPNLNSKNKTNMKIENMSADLNNNLYQSRNNTPNSYDFKYGINYNLNNVYINDNKINQRSNYYSKSLQDTIISNMNSLSILNQSFNNCDYNDYVDVLGSNSNSNVKSTLNCYSSLSNDFNNFENTIKVSSYICNSTIKNSCTSNSTKVNSCINSNEIIKKKSYNKTNKICTIIEESENREYNNYIKEIGDSKLIIKADNRMINLLLSSKLLSLKNKFKDYADLKKQECLIILKYNKLNKTKQLDWVNKYKYYNNINNLHKLYEYNLETFLNKDLINDNGSEVTINNIVHIYKGDRDENNNMHGYGKLYIGNNVYCIGFFYNNTFYFGKKIEVIINNINEDDLLASLIISEGYFIDYKLQGHCKLIKIDFYSNLELTSSYEGVCVNMDKEYKGVFETDLYKYDGTFENNKRSGKGSILYKRTNNCYEGSFYNDKIQGFGVYKWINGDQYVGNFKNNLMDGFGVYKWSNGDVYQGNYYKGMRNNQGRLFFNEENKLYIGNFVKNSPNGIGNIVLFDPSLRYIDKDKDNIISTIMNFNFDLDKFQTNDDDCDTNIYKYIRKILKVSFNMKKIQSTTELFVSNNNLTKSPDRNTTLSNKKVLFRKSNNKYKSSKFLKVLNNLSSEEEKDSKSKPYNNRHQSCKNQLYIDLNKSIYNKEITKKSFNDNLTFRSFLKMDNMDSFKLT